MSTSRTWLAMVVMAAAVHVASCGGKKIKTATPPRVGSNETGIASWYGHPYHGRRAANGEIYDMERMTAAHRTMPFDTWVRVTNLSNDRTVDVRIQDRGPFVNGRIIDLSRAAAEEIRIIGPGTAKVTLTVIKPPAGVDRETQVARQPKVTQQVELFAVQVGAFRERPRAEAIEKQMKERHGSARLVRRSGNPTVWRVLVGEEDSEQKAEALAGEIRTTNASAFVVRLDETRDQRADSTNR
jgi:rare lipoprotein A